MSRDPELMAATMRAGSMLKDRQTARCGPNACIGQDDVVDLGSASLAVVAYAQIAAGIDPSYKAQVEKLTPFIRAQQRDDGEFKHQFDKTTKRPIDIQFPYYSGEATLALARAYRVTNDPKDLESGKKRAFAHRRWRVELFWKSLLLRRRALDLPSDGRFVGRRTRSARVWTFACDGSRTCDACNCALTNRHMMAMVHSRSIPF